MQLTKGAKLPLDVINIIFKWVYYRSPDDEAADWENVEEEARKRFETLSNFCSVYKVCGNPELWRRQDQAVNNEILLRTLAAWIEAAASSSPAEIRTYKRIVNSIIQSGNFDPNAPIETRTKGTLRPLTLLVLLYNATDDRDHVIELMEMLLKQGANVNGGDEDDEIYASGGSLSPLMWAVHTWSNVLVNFLLSRGANPNLLMDADLELGYPDNSTALTMAANSGNDEAVKLLLKRGADPNIGNPLAAYVGSAEESRTEMIQRLLDHGAKVDEENEEGETPLMIASSNGYLDVVRILLEHGAQPTEEDLALAQADEVVNELRRAMQAKKLKGAQVGRHPLSRSEVERKLNRYYRYGGVPVKEFL